MGYLYVNIDNNKNFNIHFCFKIINKVTMEDTVLHYFILTFN